MPWVEPGDAFAAFVAARLEHVAFLDSGGPAGARSRWSYLAAEPTAVFEGGDDPLPFVAKRLRGTRVPDGAAPFRGGAIGLLGYELGALYDRLPALRTRPIGLPDGWVGVFGAVLAFDRHARRCSLYAEDTAAARARASRFEAALRDTGARSLSPVPRLAWHAEAPRHEHEARVARAIDYIHAGDVFQANITARFSAPLPKAASLPAVYDVLRRGQPAPFGAFLDFGDGRALFSASPEQFCACDTAGRIATRPIKGTAKRDSAPARDAALAAALCASAKDRAENLMIVDLLRNDFSRVAVPGSVHVPALCALESFASVHHLVSEVRGALAPGRSALDLLRAAFPGGSVTGAPKIRACQIIAELEGAARGAYCGTVFWAGPDGAMDSSIVIRALQVAGGRVTAQAGGGIVADSDPGAEYDEMRAKVDPILALFGSVPP